MLVLNLLTCYVAEDDPELLIFLPLPPEYWDSRHSHPYK